MDIGADAAAFFARLSQELFGEPEELVTLQRIAERAVDVVPACDWSAISLRRRRGRVETVAVSSPVVEELVGWQYTLGEGPCLDPVSEQDSWVVDDVRNDGRWPRWAGRVADAGIGSILSVRLSTETETLGALDLYAAQPFAFDTDNVDRALIFASHAATAAGAARLVTGLQTAIQSRHLIGVAQGIIMQRYDLTMDASFEVLRRYSSNANLTLRDVARMVVERRLLPDRYTDLTGPGGPLDADPGSGPDAGQEDGQPDVTPC